MKHYFIVNPTAGKINSTNFIETEVPKVLKNPDDYQIYVTKSREDCYRFVKETCKSLNEEAVFYACGGDGTSYDILNSIIDCPKAILAIVPVGSCNDFLKSYPEYDFKDLNKLINGTYNNIDVIKANEHYALNVVDAGFDARVNDDVCKMRLKHANVKKAYSKSVIKNLFHQMSDQVIVKDENGEILNGKMTLMAFGNGQYYGGGYRCAPYGKTDDGIIETVIIRKVSIFTLARLIGKYKKGEHLDNKKFKNYVIYRRSKTITVDSPREVCFCLDGETVWSKHFDISILPNKLKFLLPKK